MPYLSIIGLEIHVQLKTKSKMFCSCDNKGEDKPINTTICPICLGHPGTLPSANQQAIEWAIKAAIALNCEIQTESKFDRKHYFYPDLPKGYQISQYDKPFGKNGYLDISEGSNKHQRIRINRLHLEEDAAKLLHIDSKQGKYSIIDFNRAGTPLMEIVTEPDIRSPKTASLFLQELRLIMRALDISAADMEKGHLRCDANISLLPRVGQTHRSARTKLFPKTEIKNLNSFKAVERALEYEILRQTKLWQNGEAPKRQSTRGWNEAKKITELQREKEEAHDYRYFPEPDLPPFIIKTLKHKSIKTLKQGEAILDIESIRAEIPELPQAKGLRFREQFGFSLSDSRILTSDKFLADFTEKVLSELQAWIITQDIADLTQDEIWQKNKQRLAKMTGNWLINNLSNLVFTASQKWSSLKITAENFAEFISLIFSGRINRTIAQNILKEMFASGKDPLNILEEKRLSLIENESEIEQIVAEVLKENQDAVASYKAGKQNSLQFLIGEVMKRARGKTNPQLVSKILRENI